MRAHVRVATLVAIVAGLVAAPEAGAAVVACGDTITVDTTLSNDILNCSAANGINVGADDITLDLNGHLVDGDDIFCCPGYAGVSIANHTGVTVKDGEIAEFRHGVGLSSATFGHFVDLDVHDNLHGFHLTADSDENLIEKNSVTGNDGGVVVTGGSENNTIDKNAMQGNTGSGVRLNGGDDNVVTRNVSSGNERGVYLLGSAFSSRVEGNRISDSVAFGILLQNAGTENVIRSNKVTNNPAGIYVQNSDGNTLEENNSSKNTGGGSGIHIDANSQGNTVEDNKTDKNADDGIQVDGTSNTFTGNSAKKNGDLGFQIDPGNIDGGGNTAKGNTNPAQCFGIAC